MRCIMAGGVFSLALCGPAHAAPITIEANATTRAISARAAGVYMPRVPMIPGGLFFSFAKTDQDDRPRGLSLPGASHDRQNGEPRFASVTLSATHAYIVIVGAQDAREGARGEFRALVRAVANNGSVSGGASVLGEPQNAARADAFLADTAMPESIYRLRPSGDIASYSDTASQVLAASSGSQ